MHYCYLLGLYLGDGYVSQSTRVWRLRITLDKKYPNIIDRCRAAIDALFPGQQASIHPRSYGCVDVPTTPAIGPVYCRNMALA